MKKTQVWMLILFAVASLCSCQSAGSSSKADEGKSIPSSESASDTLDTTVQFIETTLRAQLLKTYGAANEVTDIAYFDYDRNDLDASVLILQDSLLKAGYKADKERFEQRVNDIFDGLVRVDNFLYFNNFNGQCATPKNIRYADRDGFKTNYYFSLDKQLFIGQYAIPELIDYKAIYPAIAQEEETIATQQQSDLAEDGIIYITRWKDVHDLEQAQKFNVQLLVNRNLYLFNDDKSKLPWLLKHDAAFMESLVLTFGWTADEQLLKWVMDNNKFDKRHPLAFGKMFYHKRCDGRLKLQANTFRYLQRTLSPSNQGILDDIKLFVRYFANFDEQIEELTDQERLAILSNLVYFAEQYKYEKGFENRRIMAWMYLTNGTGKNNTLLKESNYFNLPKFRQWWEKQYSDGDYEIVTEIDAGARADY